MIAGSFTTTYSQKGTASLKYSPLIHLSQKQPDKEAAFMVKVNNPALFDSSAFLKNNAIKLFFHQPSSVFIIKCTPAAIEKIAVTDDNILFVDYLRTPKEELFTGTIENNVSAVNKMQHYFTGINASGITIGIKENAFDTTDIDYRKRYKVNNATSGIVSNHASIMATISAGAGNSWYATKAAAWGSHVVSSSFTNLLPDSPAFFSQFGVSVQNHSYGTGIENYYGAEAVAYDELSLTDTSLVNVFSSGNGGTQAPATGIYTGLNGFANLSGNFKMAKNVLVAGAIDSFYTGMPISSKGPAYDGRIKPDLVAQGQDGSSGSAAIVSSIAATLQQAYEDNHNGRLPASSLIKAILINSAEDAGMIGPDYQTGYGFVNAYNAMQCLVSNSFWEAGVYQSGEQSITLNIPSGIKKLKITLAWTDPPAAVNAAKALVNDLDLELVDNSGLQKWLPWVLSSYPATDSLTKPAIRKKDTLNNVEQITLENPTAGNYTIKVKGYSISSGQQKFSLAWQLEQSEKFDWGFPMRNDPILAGEQNILRWKSTLSNTNASLLYSIDGGNQWQTISNSVDLSKGYFKWNAPAIFSKVLLKISTGTTNYITDTLVISKRMSISTGFNCADSFLLYWNRVPNANMYRLYKLEDKYLEPLFTTTDTGKVLQKNLHKSFYYAVAPIVGEREGVKSFATDYTTQGTACYLKSFYAEKINATATLHLQLGSLYGVTSIIIQRVVNGDTITVNELTTPSLLNYTFPGHQLQNGLNQFRIVIKTNNGLKIYSAIASIYYVDETNIFVYPNPVKRGSMFTVIFNDNQSGELVITDAIGQSLQKMNVQTGMVQLSSGAFPSGVYFLQLKNNTKEIKVYRLVVY